MAGYRGDGYGAYGDHGDDDYHFGSDDRDGRRGAEHGNLMGPAQQRLGEWVGQSDGDWDEVRLADDPRAVEAARQWRERYGREGHEGSWGLHDESYGRVRQRHIEELDRDYDEWCREREQQFHRDFNSWRTQRSARAAAPPESGRSVGDLMRDEGSGPASAAPGSGNVTSATTASRRRKSNDGAAQA